MDLAAVNQIEGHSTEAISLYTKASEALNGVAWSGYAIEALEKAEDIRETLQKTTADSAETIEVGEGSSLASW